MQGTNVQFLIGRLGADAETKQAGKSNVTTFRVATEEAWKDKAGEKKKETQWHTCELWGDSGVVKLLKKGVLVNVIGTTKHDSYEKKGTTETVYTTKVVVDSITLLASPKEKIEEE